MKGAKREKNNHVKLARHDNGKPCWGGVTAGGKKARAAYVFFKGGGGWVIIKGRGGTLS